MSQDRIVSQLRKLRGDVLAGEIFFIDGQPLEAIKDFNVYVEQNRFASALKSLHREITGLEEFVEWSVIEEAFVKPVNGLKIDAGVSHYRTFPFCPGYRNVLKTSVIFSSCIQGDEILDFTIEDVVAHTLMREYIRHQAFDQNLSYGQNLKNTLKTLKQELRAKEDQWMMDRLGQVVELNRDPV